MKENSIMLNFLHVLHKCYIEYKMSPKMPMHAVLYFSFHFILQVKSIKLITLGK